VFHQNAAHEARSTVCVVFELARFAGGMAGPTSFKIPIEELTDHTFGKFTLSACKNVAKISIASCALSD